LLVLLTKQIAVLNDQRLLVGVSVPHLIFYTEGPAPSAEELAAPGPFEMKVLRDFVGFVSVSHFLPFKQVATSELVAFHNVSCDEYALR
jgi:hypothetical protein